MPFRNLPGVTTCKFKPHEYLIRRGEPMPYVYYLKSGTVNRETVTKNGSVMIYAIKESGHITGSVVGLLTIFDTHFEGYSPDDFIAVTECICYRIPVDICKDYMRSQPALMEEAFVMSLDLFNRMEESISNKRDFKAPQLVGEFLLAHSTVVDGRRVLPKKFTNVEIAKHLGMHRETVSRIINTLRREGAVERMDKGLLLCDAAAVYAYVSGDKKMKYD